MRGLYVIFKQQEYSFLWFADFVVLLLFFGVVFFFGQGAQAVDLTPMQRALPSKHGVLYTLDAHNLELCDLLPLLARQNSFNFDVADSVCHIPVTMYIFQQGLPELFRRVAQVAHVRIIKHKDSYFVDQDNPYLVLYSLSSLNLKRGFKSSIGESVSGEKAGAASLLIDTDSSSQFWPDLLNNLRGFIHDGAGSAGLVPAVLPVSPVAASGVVVTSAADRVPVSAYAGAARPAASVTVDADAGLISVYARQSEHVLISDYLDQLRAVMGRQVEVDVQVVEVALSDEYQQGINWAGLNLLGVLSVSQGLQGVGSTSLTGSMFSASVKGGNVSAVMKFMQSYGKLDVLSNPKLRLSNGSSGILRVVDNYVYFTVTGQNSQNQTGSVTNYSSVSSTVPVGFTLFVNAQIDANEKILLNLRPSVTRLFGFVNDPNPSLGSVVSQVPQIQTRELDTVLAVESGATTVLGGLIQKQDSNDSDGVPVLGEIPFWGHLFKTKRNQSQKTELVIILKATVLD